MASKAPLKYTSKKRPTPHDFQNLVLDPFNHEATLLEYVGTDSRYNLAKNYAGMMVRSSVKSQDMANQMCEVAEPLAYIDIFLEYFLMDHQGIKQEQKGRVALRICLGALTALMGDPCQGNSTSSYANNPHEAVVPKEFLAQLGSLNPSLYDILQRLLTKLETCINLYRRQRSPPAALVAKFQDMADTFNFWNDYFMDNTVAAPLLIVSNWLKNHPSVVNNHRNQTYNEPASSSLVGEYENNLIKTRILFPGKD